MTQLKNVFGQDLQMFDKFFIGFDDQFNRMAKLHDEVTRSIPNYPPYNIKKVDDNKYVIEMAVVGFGKSDVEIEMIDGKLVIRGNVRNDDRDANPMEQFLYKGIADRAFTRMFALGDHVEVKNAEMFNGMLQVFLEKIIPEHKKPKKIDVKDGNEPSTKGSKSSKLASAKLLQETHDAEIAKL